MRVKAELGEPLTAREVDILEGMAAGRSNADIGRSLFLTEDTVKTHARKLFRKLGARDRAHAVATGFRSGVIRGAHPDERPQDVARLGAAHAWLDQWRPVRAEAPGGSRFAEFYDGMAVRLGTKPPPP